MWMLFGLLSVVSLFVGFCLYVKKKKNATIACCVSLASIALTITSEYLNVCKWVINNNVSNLEDVVPYVYKNFVYLVVVGVVLNLIVIFLDNKKWKK